jgi:hypothetical protein
MPEPMKDYVRLNSFAGIRVVESVEAVKDGEPATRMVRRTWRHRLCTWPWTPWQPLREETYIPKVPVYFIVNGIFGQRIIAHPAVVSEIRRLTNGWS